VSWSEPHAEAWIGLLETHRSLTRELEVTLRTEDGLTLSALEALSRLGAAKGRSLRLSALATRCGLSLSGISRLTDSLEGRGLVERRAVDSDRRAVEAHLTDAGLELARRALATQFACVQRLFFERLSDAEAAFLAEIFSRFTSDPVGASATAAAEQTFRFVRRTQQRGSSHEQSCQHIDIDALDDKL
jgi:DNA-binding MarR family transcriptional regulator